jgi:hypothetical protein
MRWIAWISWIAVAAAGCGSGDIPVRTYQEVVEAASQPVFSPELRAKRTPLAWVSPEGWVEQPASGMRLATFQVGDTECTLVQFPGSVGGMTANVERWAGQLNQPVPPSDRLDSFVAAAPVLKSQGGLEGRLFDFRRLYPDADPSMLVAVMSVNQAMLFVKLQGPRDLLEREFGRFRELCVSLH